MSGDIEAPRRWFLGIVCEQKPAQIHGGHTVDPACSIEGFWENVVITPDQRDASRKVLTPGCKNVPGTIEIRVKQVAQQDELLGLILTTQPG